MRVRTIFSAAIAALAVMVSSAVCQTPAEVVKKAVEAHGGAEALKKYSAEKSSMKGTLEITGMTIPFSAVTTNQTPDKFHNEITVEAMGMKIKIDQICNGSKFKMTINGMSMDLPESVQNEIKEAPYVAEVRKIIPLLEEKKFTLETIEKPAAVDGDEVNGILVKAEGHKEIKLFFSKKTNLLTGIERKAVEAGGGGEVTSLTKLGDYKKIDKVLHPTKVEVLHDGNAFMKAEETDFKFLEKADPAEFDISD